MNIKSIKTIYFLAIVVLFIIFTKGNALADNEWSFSLFGGRATFGSEKDVYTFKADYVDSYIAALVVGKRFWTYKEYIQFEAEAQAAKHWGIQDHFEFNGLVVLRWLPFPWDEYLDTSLAIEEGISYATDFPVIEAEKHDEVSKTLNYLMVELAFKVFDQPQWDIFSRFHHRSGVFGLFNDVSGGSNVVGVGVRVYF